MWMIPAVASRSAIDDLKAAGGVLDLQHIALGTQRNSQHSHVLPRRWDRNNVGWRLTNGRTRENGSCQTIDLVNPLSEPVAIVNGIESEVGPHVMRVVPHSTGLPTVNLSFDPEGSCVNDRDCPWL